MKDRWFVEDIQNEIFQLILKVNLAWLLNHHYNDK
jgi:hypothetical protein